MIIKFVYFACICTVMKKKVIFNDNLKGAFFPYDRQRSLSQMLAVTEGDVTRHGFEWSYKNLQHIAATKCCVKYSPCAMLH